MRTKTGNIILDHNTTNNASQSKKIDTKHTSDVSVMGITQQPFKNEKCRRKRYPIEEIRDTTKN